MKHNRAVVRDTVHKPVEDARLERLNARLLDIAQNQKKESGTLSSPGNQTKRRPGLKRIIY